MMTLLFDPIPLWKSSDTASSEAVTVATLVGGAVKGDELPELITVLDVASVFGRSERTVRRWIAKGSLPALTVGRSLFVRSEDVRGLITEGMSRQASKVRILSKKDARSSAPIAAFPEVDFPSAEVFVVSTPDVSWPPTGV